MIALGETPWVNGPDDPPDAQAEEDAREAALEEQWERERDAALPDGGSEG